ncbi:hemin receptor [Chryseobacterium sp. P1-3]|uniref:Hemin receptor n=2 Tax=Chryseobacterium gallinarum TaxID=1324352 RepID=A0A0G3M995_CHRGL|nr:MULTISPECIES: hemin receptor [Chryseobacterium]AKK73582.1 hemin receptor [Chryseobacterium gallinarum]KFF74225.1 hemin receptor [Chryseobacterium sp. P1-3]QIY90574.1 hemin receptor [Chryseobacterium gallinarum]
MLKKSLVLMSVSAAFFAQAQDVSVIRNTVDVYSGSPMVGSAKFNAMAGANGALGGDANSLLTNPAGLGVAISGEISGTLSVMGNKNSSSWAGTTVDYNKTKTDLGNVGGIIAFPLMTETAWKFINIGINYSNQSLDNYIESGGNNNLIYDFDTNKSSSFAGHAYNRYGHLSKMSFGVGANYNHSFYVGAGLNFFSASIDQYDTAAFQSLQNNSLEYFSKQNTPYFERSSGFSASLGVIGKLSPNFRLGASLETPTFWTIDRDYTFYNDSSLGDGVAYEGRKFTSPLKATVSAAFVASKNFSLNVDYTLGLTKPDYKVYGPAERELNDFFKENYKNLSEVRVGAEYRIQQFRLRGGYSYVSSPFDALTINRYNDAGTTGDQSYSNLMLNNRNLVSFGIGYDFKSFYIDASYQNITSKYSNPFMRGVLNNQIDSAYYSDNNIVQSDAYAVSDVKNNRNNFFLTLGWKF